MKARSLLQNLLLLGSLHDDPGDKDRLTATIKLAINTYGNLPIFIAFEWAKSTYKAGIEKRKALFSELEEAYPILPPDFCRLYAETLAHEPDIHDELLPETNVIWMLDGRLEDDLLGHGPLIENKLISAKKNNLALWLLPKISDYQISTAEQLLQKTSVAYLAESKRLECPLEGALQISRSINSGRDSYMFKKIQTTLLKYPGKEMWGLIIVGTAHLTDVFGSLFSLCRENFQSVSRIWPHEQVASC